MSKWKPSFWEVFTVKNHTFRKYSYIILKIGRYHIYILTAQYFSCCFARNQKSSLQIHSHCDQKHQTLCQIMPMVRIAIVLTRRYEFGQFQIIFLTFGKFYTGLQATGRHCRIITIIIIRVLIVIHDTYYAIFLAHLLWCWYGWPVEQWLLHVWPHRDLW